MTKTSTSFRECLAVKSSVLNFDGLVKSLKSFVSVIPAKAGIHLFRLVLDSRCSLSRT